MALIPSTRPGMTAWRRAGLEGERPCGRWAPMKMVIAADHAGQNLKAEVIKVLRARNIDVTDTGPTSMDKVDYPDVVGGVCRPVASGEAHLGILVCGSGTGVSISANKFHGIRAANVVNEW